MHMVPASGIIRRAARSDQAVVCNIIAEAFIPAYRPLGYIPRPAVEDHADALISGKIWLLETGNGTPAGVIILQTEDDHLAVYVVAVQPNFQGHGYGKTLLNFAEQHALAIGRRQLRLYTNERMIRNLTFYRSCGYIEIGRRPHPSRLNVTLVDMAKAAGLATSS